MDENLVLGIIAVVFVVVILYYKDYFSIRQLLGKGNADTGVTDSMVAFRVAVRSVILEAENIAADRLAEGLRNQAVERLAGPLPGGGLAPPSSPPPPAASVPH